MRVQYKDYYSLLNIKRTASGEEIRSAYLKLARKYHPDLNRGDPILEEKLKEINEAYEVLSDAERRRQFDELGNSFHSGSKYNPPNRRRRQAPIRNSPSSPHIQTSPSKGGFSEFLEGLFRTGKQNGGRRNAEEQVSAEITLSLESAHRGGLHKVSMKEKQTCLSCHGKTAARSPRCTTCDGNGAVLGERIFEINIPPGARDGSILKLARRQGHNANDFIHIRLNVRPHDLFSVSGDDLTVDLPVSPWEAALGGEVPVQTIDGEILIKIPPGSQSGQLIRMKGRGLNKRDRTRGDAYARLTVAVPASPSEQEKRLYRELARISDFDPRRAD